MKVYLKSVFSLGMPEFILAVSRFRNFGGLSCSECLFSCEYASVILHAVKTPKLLRVTTQSLSRIEFDLNFSETKLTDLN